MAKADPADQVEMTDPEAVRAAAASALRGAASAADPRVLERAFADGERLFHGSYPGYRACETEYHDFAHALDTTLAMARLVDGAALDGHRFPEDEATLAVITALFHDAGFIPGADDPEGAGLRRVAEHRERSAAFLAAYLPALGFGDDHVRFAERLLVCTDLELAPDSVTFASEARAWLGRLLGTADLMGQMADRTYLEKLLFLYREFRAGGKAPFRSEFDLLRRTSEFAGMVWQRLADSLWDAQRHMRTHFRVRHGLDHDPYARAIERQLAYLDDLVRHHPHDYRRYLRRAGIVAYLEQIEAEEA